MKDLYFIDVINDIISLCSAINNNINSSKEENSLNTYLMNLSDTTLNTICALMDFGRSFSFKVLPINLTAIFNKSYLPYWFKKNETDKKEWIVSYLTDKIPNLSKYLIRARELLIYSKEKEIKLEHNCGGNLIENEDKRYIFGPWTEDDDYDDQNYELSLKCLKCKCNVTKNVRRDYFKKQI